MDGYGTPSPTILACSTGTEEDPECANFLPASGGMSVQKYGRTTGLTKGTITAVNATVLVGYTTGVAQFVHPIIVDVSGKGAFIKSGNSGSLLVTGPAMQNRMDGLW